MSTRPFKSPVKTQTVEATDDRWVSAVSANAKTTNAAPNSLRLASLPLIHWGKGPGEGVENDRGKPLDLPLLEFEISTYGLVPAVVSVKAGH